MALVSDFKNVAPVRIESEVSSLIPNGRQPTKSETEAIQKAAFEGIAKGIVETAEASDRITDLENIVKEIITCIGPAVTGGTGTIPLPGLANLNPKAAEWIAKLNNPTHYVGKVVK